MDGLTINSFFDNDGGFDSANGANEFVDLEFTYADADTHLNEIAELYSYTEHNEFQLNVKAFEDQMEMYKLKPLWQQLSKEQHISIILKLIDQLEVLDNTMRMKAARTLLYLAQGCWVEVQSDEEQQSLSRYNVMLLYRSGVFQAFIELLNLEIENATTANVAIRKIAVSLADSVDLRVILSVLYIITEVMRAEKEISESEYKDLLEAFVQEISQPIGDELLAVKLLGMITRFCSGSAPHFPMKKVLLLLWKISLVSLGGTDTLKRLKNEYRVREGLPVITEDTLEVSKTMRASSPPPTAGNDDNIPKRSRPFRRSLMKQSSLDEQEQLGMELEAQNAENEDDIPDYYRQLDDPMNGDKNGSALNETEFHKQPSIAASIPPSQHPTLPWAPKVRQKDIYQFMDISRRKFIGYSLPDNCETTAGLPKPICEGINILKRHLYTSLADVQIKREEEITRNPLTKGEDEVPINPTEILYQAILPNLPQYMISLLKILLAAAPTSKAKTESINIMADVLPEDMPMTVTQSTKLGIDVSRHKEIIVKAVSAILLLYLKHFKINHVYQFEFMSQHLVFANCIPLVLKFFNQSIMTYVGSKNIIPIMDFPSCVIGEQPELTSDLVIGDSEPYSWRNIFSCINLLRILNKLTKWKNSRIMMLVVFKSAPILKRTLKVRHAMMQLYVLKLLKMQTKYLGRQWRKTNMKIISAIYGKVRHHLNSDWAFGNDLDARPWDFQAEECTLRTCVDRFNNRRYFSQISNAVRFPDQTNLSNQNTGLNSIDNGVFNGIENELNINNILNSENLIENDDAFDLTKEFKNNYETWLKEEVYCANPIDWNEILKEPNLILINEIKNSIHYSTYFMKSG
ncbi:hypothetical protein PVAND_007716 [Polypedilum vanderplanki]|uniref:Striatin-interacting protein n=1 Tax=Polypedilum vanderplanki TaxID=319348 RepID=A0A9J6C7T7_POLVA|nr:hypothetical protein PVAND_007716 [Polypedilum vanderplanki]